jgi:FtsZ-binding cell division protein ZapB
VSESESFTPLSAGAVRDLLMQTAFRELQDRNQVLRTENARLREACAELEKENEQLKKLLNL